MAHLLGHILRGANSDPLPVDRCAHVLQALQSETTLHERALPLAPSEPPCIVLMHTDGRLGVINAPSCPPASSCSVYSLQKRVKAARDSAFVLAPPACVLYGDSHDALLTTLATLVQISAELQQPDDLSVPPAQLPVAYELSCTRDGVLIAVPVAASTPEGSRVVISRASVAGCDVALGEAPLEVIVGFNHAPEAEGAVIDAAHRGDIPALMRLLDGGASTEAKDGVSPYASQAVSNAMRRMCCAHLVCFSCFSPTNVACLCPPSQPPLATPATPPCAPTHPCPPPCPSYPPPPSRLRARL
jgi:hypothetical protein